MADKDIHARLVIFDFDKMTKHARQQLENWLRSKADEVRYADQKEYANKYTSRLFK